MGARIAVGSASSWCVRRGEMALPYVHVRGTLTRFRRSGARHANWSDRRGCREGRKGRLGRHARLSFNAEQADEYQQPPFAAAATVGLEPKHGRESFQKIVW